MGDGLSYVHVTDGWTCLCACFQPHILVTAGVQRVIFETPLMVHIVSYHSGQNKMAVKSKHVKLLCNLADFNDELNLLSLHCYLNDDEDPLQDEVDLDCFLATEACKSSRHLF